MDRTVSVQDEPPSGPMAVTVREFYDRFGRLRRVDEPGGERQQLALRLRRGRPAGGGDRLGAGPVEDIRYHANGLWSQIDHRNNWTERQTIAAHGMQRPLELSAENAAGQQQ